MDKDSVITAIIVFAVLYTYYSGIVGIIRKKFSPIVLCLIFGIKSRDVGIGNILKKLENEEAIGAAIVQLWFAFLATLAIFGWLLDEKLSLISYDALQYAIPLLLIISTVVAVFYILKIINKHKLLKNQ